MLRLLPTFVCADVSEQKGLHSDRNLYLPTTQVQHRCVVYVNLYLLQYRDNDRNHEVILVFADRPISPHTLRFVNADLVCTDNFQHEGPL